MLQKLIAIKDLEYTNVKYNKSKNQNLLNYQRQSTFYQSLLESVKNVGLKNPLIVHPKNNRNKYKLYIGNNRLTAAKDIGMTYIKCIIGTFTKKEVQELKNQYVAVFYNTPKIKNIFTSFYTTDTPYEEVIKNLIKSFNKFNIKYLIKEYQNKGSWLKNLRYKTQCILEVMQETKLNVIYTDADSIIKQYPILFEHFPKNTDWAAYVRKERVTTFFKTGELLTGTMFFANNNNVIKFLKLWDKATKNTSDKTEQHILQQMFNDNVHKKLKFRELPENYCHIFDHISSQSPVIEHYQYSRKYRKFIKPTEVKTIIEPITKFIKLEKPLSL